MCHSFTFCSRNPYTEVHCVRKIMLGIQEALSPNTQIRTSHWMLYLYIPPTQTISRAATIKMAQCRMPWVTLWKFLVQHFLEHGLAGVVQNCGHLGALTWHRLTFFSWGYVWSCVHTDKIGDLNNLKARIREAAEQITRDMLQCVWQELEYRLGICRVMNSARMETYQLFKTTWGTL
jgi:hypothetical protein